jgi:hypothetical protein
MKTLALFLLLAGATAALADNNNLLRNGDFSSGIAEWEGDCHSLTSEEATPDLSANPLDAATATAAQGVIVKLRSQDWTKMYQDFEGKAGKYLLTISYSLSSDAKFSTSRQDYADIPAATGFSRFDSFSGTPGKWIVIVNDLGSMRFTYWEVAPQSSSGAATQTFTAQVTLNSGDEEQKSLCLIFPPGAGQVTLKSVTLAPQAGTP